MSEPIEVPPAPEIQVVQQVPKVTEVELADLALTTLAAELSRRSVLIVGEHLHWSVGDGTLDGYSPCTPASVLERIGYVDLWLVNPSVPQGMQIRVTTTPGMARAAVVSVQQENGGGVSPPEEPTPPPPPPPTGEPSERGAIAGHFIRPDGVVVPGALVTCDGPVLRQMVAADGTYRFEDLPVGTYTVSSELAGHRVSGPNVVTVGPGQVGRIDIRAEPL